MWSFWAALRLDASTVAYASAPVVVISPFLVGKTKPIASGVLKIWFWLLATAFSLIAAGDLILYDEWGTKLHIKALEHLSHPDEVLKTGTFTHYLIFAGVILSVIACSFFMGRWIHAPLKKTGAENVSRLVLSGMSLIGLGLCFVFSRGGFQPISINISQSYFSTHQILNDAAVNTTWNVAQSMVEGSATLDGNPYVFYDTEDLPKLAEPLLAGNAPQKGGFLLYERPNIVLFILESWSANAVDYAQDGQYATPFFRRMVSEGWYWDKAYTVGWKSDFGVPGVLSAWPCHDLGSICTHPSKCVGLPGIAKSLKKVGYVSDFLYGGQLIYGNIKSYVYQTGFDRVREQDDLPRALPAGRLGIQDDGLLQYALSQTDVQNGVPFFNTIYTLSSHPPFDQTVYTNTFKGGESEYLNAMLYSDQAIQHYMAKARQEPWFQNTLFVFAADHGRSVPGFDDQLHPHYFRIPVLFWGPALHPDFRGKTNGHVSSQTDIVPTLLQEMGIDTKDYPFGRNIFHPQKQHKAFVTFCGGFHVLSDEGMYGFDLRVRRSKNYPLSPAQEHILKTGGEAYLQYVMDDFLRR